MSSVCSSWSHYALPVGTEGKTSTLSGVFPPVAYPKFPGTFGSNSQFAGIEGPEKVSTARKQQIDRKWEVTGAELLGEEEDEEMEKKLTKSLRKNVAQAYITLN